MKAIRENIIADSALRFLSRMCRMFPNGVRQRQIVRMVRPFTLVSPKRIRAIYEMARRIEIDRIPGDVVECGIFNGGTAAVLAHFSSRSTLGRTMWLFDSFAGMPLPTEEDGETAKEYVGQVVGNIQNVSQVLKRVDADLKRIRIVKGWFHNTFPTVKIERIALLHIDADWYESVKLCFETFYDSVMPGGYILIDDYGHWAGCKRAVDDFFATHQLPFRLHEVDYTARWMKKL